LGQQFSTRSAGLLGSIGLHQEGCDGRRVLRPGAGDLRAHGIDDDQNIHGPAGRDREPPIDGETETIQVNRRIQHSQRVIIAGP
jgi:hypothetical protein